jgi:RNA polymerase sigma-70 factor (ECF subfamily)
VRMMRKPEDAEEVMQDAFLSYHSSAPSLSEVETGRWLHRVLVNRCLDRLRRGQRWRMTEVEETDLPTASPRTDLKLDIDRAVAALPEKARVVFLLHDVEGLKHREISKLLEVSEGTTKSQLSRARQMLRDSISSSSKERS